jgi:hypothetical protein
MGLRLRTLPGAPGKIETMPRLLTADDIMPLVASLTDSERIRLPRWIASLDGTVSLIPRRDSLVHVSTP